MTWRLAFLPLAAIWLSCAEGSRAVALRNRERALLMRRAALASPDWRSEEGFGSTRWGMTVDEVLERTSAQPTDDGQLVTVRETDDSTTAILYGFASGRLSRVRVAIEAEAEPQAMFRTYRTSLAKAYGPPSETYDSHVAALVAARESRLIASMAQAGATAIGRGNAPGVGQLAANADAPLEDLQLPWHASAEWRTDQTILTLLASEERGVALIYQSRVLDLPELDPQSNDQ